MVALRSEQIPALTRDKQLLEIDAAAALFKWHNGIACNLKEVAVSSGYGYWLVRSWDLPLFHEKITKREFEKWKRDQMKAEIKEPPTSDRAGQPPGPGTRARQRRLAAGKSDESPCSRD